MWPQIHPLEQISVRPRQCMAPLPVPEPEWKSIYLQSAYFMGVQLRRKATTPTVATSPFAFATGPIRPEVESAGAHITILEKCANEVPIVESALYISNKVQ